MSEHVVLLRSWPLGGMAGRYDIYDIPFLAAHAPYKGWAVGWYAWAPAMGSSCLGSGFVNVPDLRLEGLRPEDMVTGRVHKALLRADESGPVLAKIGGRARAEGVLVLFGHAPGWGARIIEELYPPGCRAVWSYLSVNAHGMVWYVSLNVVRRFRRQRQPRWTGLNLEKFLQIV